MSTLLICVMTLIHDQVSADSTQNDYMDQQGSSASQQGDSECNIFNLTESELMEEDEYAADLCDDIDTRPDDAKQSSEKAAVKKKLFTDWTDSIRPPSDDEDVTNQPPEPSNRKFGIPSNQPITLKPTNGSDDFIELDDDIRPSSNLKEGARRLLERAMKHTSAKVKPAGQTVSLNITTTERDSQGEITGYSSEALSIVLEDNAELAKSNRGAECVPGARRVVLKKQLEEQMAKNREKAWMRRIEEAKMDEETYAGEKSDCEADKEEEEEEFDEEELTTEEDEEEENIMEKPRKKKRVKSAFVDEEAEVSDEEGVSADEEEDEEEGDKEEEEKEDDKEEEEEDKGEDEEESKDVNDEDKPSQVEESPRSLKSKSKTFDMFMTQKTDGNAMECDDDELPAYQMGMNTEQSNGCTPAHDKVVFSPVVTLTGCDKTVSKSRNASFLVDSQPTSPLHHSPKKLNFDDEPSTLELGGLDNLLPSQTKGGEDLEALFSGQFSTQAPVLAELEQNDGPCDYQTQTQAVPQGVGELLGNTCSSNLSGLCSGAFTSQPIDPKLLEINDGTCGKFITSTSMDENETPMPEAAPTLVLNKSSILSSDDEDDLDTSIQMKKQTKTLKRLVYSDDEEEDKDNEGEDDGNEGEDDEDNEEDDLEEKEGGEDESDIEQEEGADVLEAEYDSEENEIVARKVGDFFEAEAELSESEWGSEDEDENEMDKMEQEEADKEYHDQDQLKEELGKIHMKQILDDDNREVKLLQEMLLEDGELHSDGPGRQRQFRWSNVDDNADLRITAHFSDDSEPEDKGEDKEEDETWRKISLERELYLESQKDKLEQMESLEAESSSSEVTRTVILNDLKNKVVRAAESKVPSELPIKSPDSKLHALMGLHKRSGSFLTRGAQSWVRLSKITQGVGDDMDRKIVKKRGNFVFAALESGPEPSEKPAPQQPETPKADDKVQPKRKKSLATPPLLKKLKLHDGSQSKSSMLSKLMQADF
ncbi:hypothetical protein M8J77_010730 [Diaphorina citri]|nr:hypothetical protein M8J77_010730 [Diaphorina citri]